MRRQLLATLFIVASASVTVPATAHAGGSPYGGSNPAGVARIDRSQTWGIGSLRIQKSGFGVGFVSKDGSKMRGIFNVRNVSATTTSTLKVRGSKYDSAYVTHANGPNGRTTDFGRTVGDKHGVKHEVRSVWGRNGNYIGGFGRVVVRGSARAVEKSQRRFHSQTPNTAREASELLGRTP